MKTKTLGALVAGFLLINLFLIGWAISHRSPPELRVAFLDVGQGDACVLETPTGKVIVIDTGGVSPESGDDEGRRTVAPYLRSRGINRIDVMILSHPHADHIGGAKTLIEQFEVGTLIDNGQDASSALVSPILNAALLRHVLYQRGLRGMKLDCKDGVTAQILAPTLLECENEPPNNASVVAKIQFGNTSFLFTGDAERAEEDELTRSGEPLQADVLKAGHHGSHSSTSPQFLGSVHPSFAVISVGAHNRHGHPTPEVIERLRESHIQTYRTDKSGAVIAHSDGLRIRMESVREGGRE